MSRITSIRNVSIAVHENLIITVQTTNTLISLQTKAIETPVEPHKNDILMGRGGKNNQHIGNETLRSMARLEAENYRLASKKGKSLISRELVLKVRSLDPPGRFLKKNSDTGLFEDVGDEVAREKASQVLRDAVANTWSPPQKESGYTSGSIPEKTGEIPERAVSDPTMKSTPDPVTTLTPASAVTSYSTTTTTYFVENPGYSYEMRSHSYNHSLSEPQRFSSARSHPRSSLPDSYRQITPYIHSAKRRRYHSGPRSGHLAPTSPITSHQNHNQYHHLYNNEHYRRSYRDPCAPLDSKFQAMNQEMDGFDPFNGDLIQSDEESLSKGDVDDFTGVF
jgi:hypothetical protein